jgi:hypothetical protein
MSDAPSDPADETNRQNFNLSPAVKKRARL